MSKLEWDKTGERFYETGTDRGVLYPKSSQGLYPKGYAWNGLTAVSKSPSGAEATALYADNIKYLNLVSAEEFAGTITAYSSPVEFDRCDGSYSPTPGLSVGQQTRQGFGLSWRTLIGNDIDGQDHGYKIHLAYDALAAPSARDYTTVNDTPEAMELSWEFSTTPVAIGQVNGVNYRPSATLTIDTTKTTQDKIEQIEEILYGKVGVDARLPLPAEVISILNVVQQEVTPVAPTAVGSALTIPVVAGVEYRIDGVLVTGEYTLTDGVPVLVVANPETGYKFPAVVDVDWLFEYNE